MRSIKFLRLSVLAASAVVVSLGLPAAQAQVEEKKPNANAAANAAADDNGPKEIVPGTPFKVDSNENTKVDGSPEERVALFFERLKKREVDLAYKELLRGSKIAEVAKDVDLLQTKTVEAIRFAGAITGADWVERRNVGENAHLVGLTYISLGKNFPLRWRFYFYKVEEQWKLIDIRISDRLPEMFKEGATPYDTKE